MRVSPAVILDSRHLVRTVKGTNDIHVAEKLTTIVGLYLNPPEDAIVLCADEKNQIQALDRTQPGLPLKTGRCGTMAHDYKRYGTATTFATLNTLDGTVISDGATPKEEQIHLAGNYAVHRNPRVQR